MKMKLSIIAAVMAAGFAVQANAAITTFSGFNDQIFLSVWDATAQTSYTRGLGLTINDMVSGAGINFGTATNGSGFTASGDSVANNYSLAADSNLTSFLSAAAAAGDTVNWSVVGGDVPANNLVYGANGFVTTSSGVLATIQDGTIQSGMNGFPGKYLNGVNNLMPSGSVAGNLDSISTSIAAGSAYVLTPTNGFGDNFGSTVTFSNAAALGNALDFNLITATTGSRGYNGNGLIYQFANANGASTWTLGSNGTLTYAVASVAAVPEPSEIGLMLSGFGLVGFIAKKRREKLKRA
ncbi:MAG TPA: PEP-CTERM sorting domain-containing protein [Burkholderiales bacterium]|nr:PEP-CTERM sorting domain-containing protein [Burkholderiales bacterium]